MWKLLFQSVRGTAHERGGLPCQDDCLARIRRGVDGPVLLLACADGAGSAHCADVGARLAVAAAVRHVSADLADGLPLDAIDRDVALSWLLRVRADLTARAAALEVVPDELACTLLLAVVGEGAAVFVQVGDGAIVRADGDSYGPVFWPQAGEYANSTRFVTDEDAADGADFVNLPQRLDELALFTDGLQTLALRFAERTAHGPFFRPMFERLRASTGGEGLSAALRVFLESAAVSARTDDDKTLMLATRIAVRADAPQAP